MENILAINYGEVSLKGRNKSIFISQLVKNIKLNIRDFEKAVVLRDQGRLYIEEYEQGDEEAIIGKLKEVFGIYSIIPAFKFEGDMETIKKVVLIAARQHISEIPIKSFKVETKRVNKQFPMKSPEVCRELGGLIFENIDGIEVDVHHPDMMVFIEIRSYNLVFTKRIYALGGLPYKTGGRAMLLLSGGIDSPVAGWMTAKRGLEIEAVHFHSYPFTSERAEEKVMDLAKHLCRYVNRMVVHSVNLLPIQKAINEKCKEEEMTILSRRFMMRIAEKIADERHCQALVTGESLGQVASQTIEGISVTNQSVDLPVIRPLIALDKVDIMEIAQRIGTFETSILPFEDCCSVFLPKKPLTKPKLSRMLASEKNLDANILIESAILGKTTREITLY
ncbi:MAG: tRNA 4-thiouridine(8) synthase ThiI [Peptostreptococcaceae bacterium]|nr:tRNA 4-thiouridine(8) synthase ThiI [Peptostreptococcaceae bacterium]